VHFFYDEEMTLIHKLVELQTIDTKLKDINDLLGDLPSRVKELDQQEDTIKANLEKSQIRLKELEVKLHRTEVRIAEINDKINKYKDQLFLVTNNKQYDALMHEIDHLKEERVSNESESLSFMEEKETLINSVNEMATELEILTQDLSSRREKLESAISESADEKSNLEQNRAEQVSQIDAKFISEYDRVLAARDGLAVVNLSGGACGGCGAYIPAQIVAEIRGNIVLHRCDVCGRFLYSENNSVN
jgi:predicted  nucleic acid-binding Zn-ribbon protein